MPASKQTSTEEVQQLILEAAESRFTLYGYNKTTMAEIAKDCNMSASNIYRFFQNKLDIGASIAADCLNDEAIIIQIIVAKKHLSAEQRLSQIILAILDKTFNDWSDKPKMNELVGAICQERVDLVDQHMMKKQAYLITLLREGVDNQEFSVKDLEVTAEAISVTLTMFDVPIFMPMFSLETFERKAKGVIELILTGLRKR